MDSLARDRTIKGLLLKGLYHERSNVLSDVALQAYMEYTGYHLEIINVRNALDYLAGKEYVELNRNNRKMWMAKLDSQGEDLILGNIPPDPGILTPPV